MRICLHFKLHFLFVVPTAPRDLQANSVDGYTIRVTWKPPLKLNGVIHKFEVSWKKERSRLIKVRRRNLVMGQEHSDEHAFTVGQIREHFLRNLDPYSVYKIRVRERTAKDWSPFTNFVEADTPEGSKYILLY